MASTDAINASAGKVYLEFKYLSADEQAGGVKFTCNLQGLYKWDNSWRDLKSTVYKDAAGCTPGQDVAIKSAIAGANLVNGKYLVAARTPESGCFDGCMLEQKYQGGDRSQGCYLVKGSTTQGFCNYVLTTTGTSCAANTLSAAATGDPLVKPEEPEEPTDPGDDGTGTPTNPGCVFDCDNGGNNGTGGTGSGGGTGGTGDGGTGGSDGDGSSNGGDSGSGSGNGGDGSSGSGSGGTPGGNGSNGTGSGSGDPGTGTPCKGLNFGEAGCTEYASAQVLNGSLEGMAEGVKIAQDSVWDSLDDVQGKGDKVQQDAEESLLQRFGSMLPSPGACVNPVMDFGWTVISVDVCRFTFVKQILGWMFAVFTMIYVFRVMTSLGTNSEV
ncbi:hypothetical protein SB757_03060 [Pseudomonas sp. SIMBA_065]